MKAQQLEQQCMIPRALFGGVENTSKSVYSSDSQLLLSKPSVSGAYFRNAQKIQLLGYQYYCFQYAAADVFFFVSVILFLVRSRCVFFSCHRIISHDRIYVEQRKSIGGQILLNVTSTSILDYL